MLQCSRELCEGSTSNALDFTILDMETTLLRGSMCVLAGMGM